MSQNKRLQRKVRARSEAKQKRAVESSPTRPVVETQPFRLLEEIIEMKESVVSSQYILMRKLSEKSPTPAWKIANNIFEAVCYGRKPAPLAPGEFEHLARIYDKNAPDIVELFAIQKYADVDLWEDPHHSLCQQYASNHSKISLFDLPAVGYFFAKGWLEPSHAAVPQFLRMLDIFVEEISGFEIVDFSKLLHLVDKPSPARKLCKLEEALGQLEFEPEEPQLFFGLIRPLIKGILSRYYRSPKLKLDKYPTIKKYLKDDAGAADSSLDSIRWHDPTKIDFTQFHPKLLDDRDFNASGGVDYRTFIKRLLLSWRFMAEAHGATQNPHYIKTEAQKFAALWSALSHGVPQQEKEFASKVKFICSEFFQKILEKCPRYQPESSVVTEFVKFDGTHDGFRWLLFSTGGFSDRRLSSRSQNPPRPMPFALFYNLYVHRSLSTRSDFIGNYFEILPRESQREILSQWFYRAQGDLQDKAKLNELARLTFDKLLRVKFFPVTDLGSSLDLDPAILTWSLAYLKYKKLPCPVIGYQKGLSVLDYLINLKSPPFFSTFGETLVLELFPQLCEPESFRLGMLKRLVELVSKYENPTFEDSLKKILTTELLKLAPREEILILQKTLNEKIGERLGKQLSAEKYKKRRRNYQRNRDQIPF